jgi:hypothetical protein
MTNAIANITPDQLVEISKNNVQSIQGLTTKVEIQDRKINSLVKDVKVISETMTGVIKRINYIELKQPISANQRMIIRKKVSHEVYRILGKNKARKYTSVAYPMAYRCLQPYGYKGLNTTETQFFEGIIEAIDNGVINV